MNIKIKINLTFGLSIVLMSTMYAGLVSAHEPGVLPTIPDGASIGMPIAAPTPVDGIFFSSRSAISSQHYYDANGDKTETEIDIKDSVFQFVLSPGKALFGGQYRAFLSVPLIDIESKNIATPFGLANGSNSGIGSVEIRPADISWELSSGIYMNAGFSVYTPGDWSASELVNPGQNFWSFSPSVGVSYLRNGWNASAHLLYFANKANEDNDYKSGNETHLNLTLMKNIGDNLSVGAVGYIRKQLEDDENPNNAYGGALNGRASSSGIGISLTKQFGPINLNVMYTTNLETKNSGGGERIWLNVVIPLKVFGM
ncbi:SphA family protein [Flavobacterium sp. W21_SRS_FM6]|uniref:SphA family protein n=1 Tax=Flavobacterium sp. W21_SRS_FM6 TaxID=3240268 RepID=UPI003F91011F